MVLAQQFKANTVENQIVKPVLNTVFSNYELVSLDVTRFKMLSNLGQFIRI